MFDESEKPAQLALFAAKNAAKFTQAGHGADRVGSAQHLLRIAPNEANVRMRVSDGIDGRDYSLLPPNCWWIPYNGIAKTDRYYWTL